MASVKTRISIVWAYVAEFIAAGLLYVICFLVWDANQISDFMLKSADSWVTKFLAIMLAGSIAFFWTFYSNSNIEFAKWLYYKKAFNTYLAAFITAIAIFTLTTISFIIAQTLQSKMIALISGGLLILCIINVISFFKNIIDVIKINIAFNAHLDKEK